MIDHTDLKAAYTEVMAELDELAEVWLEHRAAGLHTNQISTAIDQATRESRKYEKKLKRAETPSTSQ